MGVPEKSFFCLKMQCRAMHVQSVFRVGVADKTSLFEICP